MTENSALILAPLWQIFLSGLGDAFVTVRASSGRRSREEVEDGLPDGRHARLWRRRCDTFFPSRRFEAAGLEKGEGDHRHQAMSVQPCP